MAVPNGKNAKDWTIRRQVSYIEKIEYVMLMRVLMDTGQTPVYKTNSKMH